MHPYIGPVASTVPFDNTNQSFYTTDVQSSLQELRNQQIIAPLIQATSLNGTLTLTSSNPSSIVLTGTATGYSVQLPNATTLFTGIQIGVYNQSNQTVTVKDGSGVSLFTLAQTSIGILYLQDNGTTAGTWIFYQTFIGTATGIVSYYVISTSAFSVPVNSVDNIITGMTVVPQAGTYSMWFNCQVVASGSGQQLDCTFYNGVTALTDSIRSNLSSAGTHVFQLTTQSIAQFNGTNACAVYVNPHGGTMSINARSMILIRLGT